MADLLKRISLPTNGRIPVMMELPVNPETSPYLVSAAGRSRLIWIPNSKGRVKAGVRCSDRGEINLAITKEVALVGQGHGWGNVHQLTESGLTAAVDHLSFYGIKEVEVLVGSEGLPFLTDLPVRVCDWLPGGCAVVVPESRDFVGVIADIGQSYLVVVHNPSRGMAILGQP